MSDAPAQMRVPEQGATAAPTPKIGIVVVAYNAASTLAGVLDRVPSAFRRRITRVFVCDDASEDATYLVGLGYQQTTTDLPLTIIRNADNLGYGGNQKAGYRLAIEHGLDIVVLLHGDGQYAPEYLAELVGPLERGECDAVMGSRMIEPGAARRGGMPLYKYVGNKLLTRFENRLLGTSLSEFHSGYRAYNVEALKSIPFERNSDGFNFDTQIIIQLIDAGKTIAEVPIPTYYGDEICYVNGLQYARDVSADVVRYRLAKLGFLSDDLGSVGEEYALKAGERSSHAVILRWLEQLPPGRILDLGCSGGLLSERARALGHRVVGVDRVELPELAGRVDSFIEADLDQGLPEAVEHEGPFDIVLAGDVLEHLREPGLVLAQVRRVMVPRGALLVSVPNFGHWYVRARALLGIFDYDQRGLLDSTHVRFFTRRSIERMLRRTGFNIVRRETTGLPLEVVRGEGGKGTGVIDMLDRATVAIRPTLFGYQFAYHCELSPAPSPSDESTPSL